MRISWRDSIATVLVAIGVVIYGAWVVGFEIPGLGEPIAVAIAILALGVVASLSAVVPGFGDLLRGSKAYLVTASFVGLIAFGAGVCTIAGADPTAGLAILTVSTVVLWVMSTMRHLAIGPARHHPLHA
jgi:hypothetical protein